MKSVAIAIGVLFSANFLFATNGSNLIGASPAGSAMGGTGVAYSESPVEILNKNPALLLHNASITEGKTAVELDVGVLKLSTQATFSNTALSATGSSKENGLSKFVPQIGAAYRLNSDLAVGLGFISYAGTMADYTGQGLIQEQKTDFSVSKLVPSVAWAPTDWLAFGVSPLIGVGQFSLNETLSNGSGGVPTGQSQRAPHTSVAFGGHLGASAKLNDQWQFGLTALSETKYTYKNLTDLEPFGGAAQNGLDDMPIEQPMEIAAGVTFRPSENWTVTGDYRLILWENAETLKEFGWHNQSVFGLGAQWAVTPEARLRVGTNYGKSPLESATGEVGTTTTPVAGKNLLNSSISSLNVNSFPAVTEWHVTLGAGYALTADVDVDAGFVYAFQKEYVRSGSLGAASYSYSNKVSNWTLALGATWRL